jgi:hypothetical protein
MEKSKRNKGLEWCPEADLNHRHADFQSCAICGCSIASDGNSVKPASVDQRLSPDLSNPSAASDEAARWLLDHRDECAGRIIPTLKTRFHLSTCEAIAAAQKSHALQYGGV